MSRSLGLWSLCFLLCASAAAAQNRPSIVITDPNAKTYKVALQRFFEPDAPGATRQAELLREKAAWALDFSSLFATLADAAFLEPVTTPEHDVRNPPRCENWKQIGADALVQGEIRPEGTELSVEFRVWDVARGCVSLLHKRYRGGPRDVDRIGKAIGDDVVGAFTGKRGVAGTEIAFISDRTGSKEVYIQDLDGGNVRRATNYRSINTFPSWNDSGDAIVYTSYRHQQRPSIFVLTRGRTSPGRILRSLNGRAPQYRAVFAPDGERLALVMSVGGSTEIYIVGKDGRNLRRLTRNGAIDIAPSWSPDGTSLAFVSDRSGSPQVYVMDQDGAGVRRITFQGSYNTAPAWSPDGRWIAYETRVGGQFDIWITDPEGSTAVPLVTHPRSDEHPTWAPDGRKLAFSSTRRGRADLYAVDLDGGNLRRLTSGAGNNTTPDWGPYRR